MSGFKSITTQADLDSLDSDAIVDGYRAGLRDVPDYTRRDQAYWHGYMNGQVDTGRMPISTEQRLLARNTFEATFASIFGSKH